MPEIRTSITIVDNFSGALNNLTNSVGNAESALSQFQNQFNSGIDVSSFSSASNGVQSLASSMSYTISSISDSFGELHESISEIGDSMSMAADNVVASQQIMSDASMFTADQMTSAAQNASSAAIAAASAAGDGVTASLGVMGDSATNAANAMSGAFANVPSQANAAANTISGAFTQAAQNATQAAQNAAQAQQTMGNAAQTQASRMRAVYTSIVNPITNTARRITIPFSKAFTLIRTGAVATGDALLYLPRRMISAVSYVLSPIGRVVNAFRGIGTAAQQASNQSNAALASTESKLDELTNKVKGLAAAYVTVQGGLKVLELSDKQTNLTARLNLVNDGKQTSEELSNMIFDAANRVGVDNDILTKFVAKVGTTAKQAFTGNKEMVQFAETLQKAFAISSTDAQEAGFAMLQISQSLASGVLQGDEFKSISENAAIVLEAVANYMGKSREEVSDLSSEGKITAQTLKNALLAAGDEITKKFNKMPNTFGTSWIIFQNHAKRAFSVVFKNFEALANSKSFDRFVKLSIALVYKLADAANWAIAKFKRGMQLLVSMLPTIVPIALMVGAAIGTWVTWLALARTYAILYAGVMGGILAAKVLFLNAKFLLLVVSVKKLHRAMALVRASALVNPIAVGIAAIMALFYGAIKLINYFTDANISAVGVIAGAFAWLWTAISNVFKAIWNTALRLAEFIANVFIDPFAAIQLALINLRESFSSFFDFVMAGFIFIGKLVSALWSKVTGFFNYMSDLSGAMSAIGRGDFAEGIDLYKKTTNKTYVEDIDMGKLWFESNADAIYDRLQNKDEKKQILEKHKLTDLSEYNADYGGLIDAFNGGYDFGKNLNIADLVGQIGDYANKLIESTIPKAGANSGYDEAMLKAANATASNTGKTAKNTSQKDKDETLKFLREIGEREAIYNVHRNTIKLEVSNNNNISKEVDADSVITKIVNSIMRSMSVSANGVHE